MQKSSSRKLKILMAWILLGACGEAPEGVPFAKNAGQQGEKKDKVTDALRPALACKKESLLTWENFGRPFLVRYCSSCHSRAVEGAARAGAPSKVDFDELSDVASWRARIYNRAVANQAMPPFNLLSAEERGRLGEWIGCGAP